MNAEKLLVIAKTYPTPSQKYIETTCVAALNEQGEMRRIYPVPYRFLEQEQTFTKWQWVEATLGIPNDDRRPESRRIDTDSISVGNQISTGKNRDWQERLLWIQPHIVSSFAELEQRRQATGETLGILKVSQLLELEITPTEPSWSVKEQEKLSQDLRQPGLFDDPKKQRPLLEKIPCTFHYRYSIDTPNGPEESRHMITDWEAGALYRNCVLKDGTEWKESFRQRYESEFSDKDLYFVMGTMHRFPNQWLIISVIYPRKSKQTTLDL
jgi:hypothetical protein